MDKLKHLLSHWEDYQRAEMAGDLSKDERNYFTLVENYILGCDDFFVLEMHYIDKKTFRKIADELGYEERTIYRYRDKQTLLLHNMLVGSWRYNNG